MSGKYRIFIVLNLLRVRRFVRSRRALRRGGRPALRPVQPRAAPSLNEACRLRRWGCYDGVRKACHCDGGIQFAFRDSCCRECFGRSPSASTVIVCGIAALPSISAILSKKFAGDLPRLSFLFFIVRCGFRFAGFGSVASSPRNVCRKSYPERTGHWLRRLRPSAACSGMSAACVSVSININSRS